MPYTRFTDKIPSSKILGESLTFRSGKKAPNRFLKSALTELVSTFSPKDPKNHGVPTQEILNIYEKWGQGQFGMILTGNVQVHPTNLEHAGNVVLSKDGETPERLAILKQWAVNTKRDGALAVVQLSHGGRQTPISLEPHPFSASDVQLDSNIRGTRYGKPIPLTTEQVKTEVVDRFVYAAKIAYQTGFDGIQLHGAHGYLLSQFTSPTTNKRTDKYGGSLENRVRVVLEIFDGIRAEIPASTGFLIGLKTNSVEYQHEGTTLEEAKEMCRIYEEKGFDFVELSGGNYEKMAFAHFKESTARREAFFVEFAEQIRPVFKKTVVYLTGGFRTAQAMVDAVESGATQGIGLGRPATAEPDLPKKILNGIVGSAVKDLFVGPKSDLTTLSSGTQLVEMGETSLKEAINDVMFGISDYSDQAVFDEWQNLLAEFLVASQTKIAEGNPVIGVPVFKKQKSKA